MNHALETYKKLTGWVHRPEDLYDPVKYFRVELLIAVTLITSVLMWTYGFVSFNYIAHPSITYVGFLYAFMHFASPAVYRLTGSLPLATYAMLIPGGAFQTHFSLLTGGFHTPTLIWVGILPLIAGLLTNRLHTLIWSGIVCVILTSVFILDYKYQALPNLLQDGGQLITQLLITYGMVVLNCIFTIFILQVYKINNDDMRQKVLAKQSLLHVIIHDISNPLSVVNLQHGMIEKKLAAQGVYEKGPKIKDMMDNTEKSVKRIIKIIDSVREMEAVATGKKNLALRPVSLENCIDNCLELLKGRLDLKGLRVVKKIDNVGPIMGIPAIVEQQIVTNILTNAIKFSPEGSEIELDVKAFSDTLTELSIRDYGVGMPQYIVESLFDPLAKTNRGGTAGEVGTGFGMPITKNSISLMGGEISVETSTENSGPQRQGTRFRLFFKKGVVETKNDTNKNEPNIS